MKDPFARLGIACRDHLGSGLLRGLLWLLVLLLSLLPALEPVAAQELSTAAVAHPFPEAATSTPGASFRESPVQTSDPAASVPELFQRALEASRAGRFDLALPLWNRVLEQAPKDAAAWSNRGNVQLALGDPLAAIADQDHSLLLEPNNADPHLNRGIAEEALGRWDAAAADYGWILERDPADASALYNLGNVQGARGDWQAARDSFVTAADTRPGMAMARSSAALAAFQLGDLATAERELRSLIRRYPLFADARAGLTALLWQRGATGEAESHWTAASGLDPRYRQGEWLLSVRRWPPAPVAALERFLMLTRCAGFDGRENLCDIAHSSINHQPGGA
jgi:tetratricopeptide (TPR) repeat protein